jgi:hypothetical protein
MKTCSGPLQGIVEGVSCKPIKSRDHAATQKGTSPEVKGVTQANSSRQPRQQRIRKLR